MLLSAELMDSKMGGEAVEPFEMVADNDSVLSVVQTSSISSDHCDETRRNID